MQTLLSCNHLLHCPSFFFFLFFHFSFDFIYDLSYFGKNCMNTHIVGPYAQHAPNTLLLAKAVFGPYWAKTWLKTQPSIPLCSYSAGTSMPFSVWRAFMLCTGFILWHNCGIKNRKLTDGECGIGLRRFYSCIYTSDCHWNVTWVN